MQEETKIINDGEIDLFSVWKNLVREKFLILFLTILSTSSAVLYTYTAKPIWSGSFDIVVKKNNQTRNSISSNPLISSLVIGEDSQNRTEEIILGSPLVLMPVFEYVKNYYNKKNIDTTYLSFSEWAANELKIGFQNKSQILKVSYKNNDKDHILKTLNMISKKYQNYSKRDREKSINKTISYLKSQQKIMSVKALDSQKELNKFSIENGLGNIDGFVELGAMRNNFKKLLTLQGNAELLNQSPLGALSMGSSMSSNAGQRFASQYALLEQYETQYINLSSKLKPNSETLRTLSLKIDTLRSSLKRPNEILIKYRELSKQAMRDSLLLEEIEGNIEIMNLEKIKSPDPWELISQPVISPNRIFPNRKLITSLSFLTSLLISSTIALIKQKNSGLVYEFNDLEKIVDAKYLNKIYINNPNLSRNLILKILDIDNSENKPSTKTGLVFSDGFSDKEFIKQIVDENKNIQEVMLHEDNVIRNLDNLIIFMKTPILNSDLELLNKYIFINSKKIIGWFYLDSTTTF
tara:strand:- start:526 stop:2091 length:1566 start_codon:yes stop_codon:yes gene_type:complete